MGVIKLTLLPILQPLKYTDVRSNIRLEVYLR